WIASYLLCAACSGAPSGLPSFRDPIAAPSPIWNASKAVVKVRTAGQAATGAFVSDSGLLLTNNHVLGADVCPIEGCFAEISIMRQHGTPYQKPAIVFAMPMAVNVGLDMAFVQLLSQPNGDKLSTPDFLTIDSRDGSSLLGSPVHVIGHPEGG